MTILEAICGTLVVVVLLSWLVLDIWRQAWDRYEMHELRTSATHAADASDGGMKPPHLGKCK